MLERLRGRFEHPPIPVYIISRKIHCLSKCGCRRRRCRSMMSASIAPSSRTYSITSTDHLDCARGMSAQSCRRSHQVGRRCGEVREDPAQLCGEQRRAFRGLYRLVSEEDHLIDTAPVIEDLRNSRPKRDDSPQRIVRSDRRSINSRVERAKAQRHGFNPASLVLQISWSGRKVASA